jgi:hypoxanthine phosphoribosyltransferase
MTVDIEREIISQESLIARVRELAREIELDFGDSAMSIILISNGAILFGADLIREIRNPLQLDSISVSSYIGTERQDGVKFLSELKLDIANRRVLVVDDIYDSGQTLSAVCDHLAPMLPASISTCVLLKKDRDRDAAVVPDYYGFSIEDVFVVGYGLDYRERYRNLPFIGVLKANIYNEATP